MKICANKSCKKAGEPQDEKSFWSNCSKCISCSRSESRKRYEENKNNDVYVPAIPLPKPLRRTVDLAIAAIEEEIIRVSCIPETLKKNRMIELAKARLRTVRGVRDEISPH